MKITQKTNQKKIWMSVAVLAILLIGSFITYVVFAHNGDIPSSINSLVNNDKPGDNSSLSTENKTEESKTTPPNTDPPAPTKTDESTGKRVVSMVASANINGTFLYIRGGLNALETEGICSADLKGPQGEVIHKETPLLPSASTTDCKTISMPVSDLSAGTWTFILRFSSNNAIGTSNETSFVVQ